MCSVAPQEAHRTGSTKNATKASILPSRLLVIAGRKTTIAISTALIQKQDVKQRFGGMASARMPPQQSTADAGWSVIKTAGAISSCLTLEYSRPGP